MQPVRSLQNDCRLSQSSHRRPNFGVGTGNELYLDQNYLSNRQDTASVGKLNSYVPPVSSHPLFYSVRFVHLLPVSCINVEVSIPKNIIDIHG